MASGFFALLDDIAVLLDDVAALTKVATKKTAGILADDLAVNAEKASGFVASRELPVLWKITKGSFINKLIILPAIFLLSAFLPIAIIPILLVGGIYLAYEGAEKIFEFFFHRHQAKPKAEKSEMSKEEIIKLESGKIKSAIIVDFILSIEIVIIALSSVLDQTFQIQIGVVTSVAIMATIGVYGIVALIVRIDDLGLKLIALSGNKSGFLKSFGTGLVRTLPMIVKALSVIGTLAMVLVAGGIFVHNVHFVHDHLQSLPELIPTILIEFSVGLFGGMLVLLIMNLGKKAFKKLRKSEQ